MSSAAAETGMVELTLDNLIAFKTRVKDRHEELKQRRTNERSLASLILGPS